MSNTNPLAYTVDQNGALNPMKLPVIGEIDFNTVRPLDTIYLRFGGDYQRAIIKNITRKGIIFTLPTWVKAENQFLSFEYLACDDKRMPMFHGPRYSKLRWFLKF